ncbi:MAG: P1 family peptidase [Candidatus Neomarinimicrobiota bacterium]
MTGRQRDLGLKIGGLPTGPLNSITDIPGVTVGHYTAILGEDVRTGATAILPHGGNLFQEKVPAAIAVGNGFGKLIGFTQVEELGQIETPIILTNTLSAPIAAAALIDYTLNQPGNETVRSVNPVVGETNDGRLNNIRRRYLREEHFSAAIAAAGIGSVAEGSIGAGTGTVCLGFKGGIGTASRVVRIAGEQYALGVLVQTNFGGSLQIVGIPVGQEIPGLQINDDFAGSCMIVVATDAPLLDRQLKRLVRRTFLGMGQTGGIMAHGSGDYAIAFSTAETLRMPRQPEAAISRIAVLRDEFMNPLFKSVIDATEEAILNSLVAASTITGYKNFTAPALPLEQVKQVLKKYNRI